MTSQGLYMKTPMRRAVVLTAVTIILSVIFTPGDVFAFPIFSRQVGRDCTFCHSLFPKLNEQGRIFRSNGYRFEAEGSWKEAKDLTTLPASVELELEAAYNRVKSSGVRSESSDMKVEELELSSGGAFGKTGKVSALGQISVAQSEEAGTTTYTTSINSAFIQINDLAGSEGTGLVNLKTGQMQLTLPFLGGSQRFINNNYFVESALKLFNTAARVVELNGSVLADEETGSPTHRYSAGISREDVNKDDKIRGYYATYALTVKEAYNIGFIYRGGREKNGAADLSYNKLGAAAEAELGPFDITAGYFASYRSGLKKIDNYLLEAIYRVNSRVSAGARYDYLKERVSSRSQNFMVRYNILSNVYALLELRALSDTGHLAGPNESERKARLFLVAIF